MCKVISKVVTVIYYNNNMGNIISNVDLQFTIYNVETFTSIVWEMSGSEVETDKTTAKSQEFGALC